MSSMSTAPTTDRCTRAALVVRGASPRGPPMRRPPYRYCVASAADAREHGDRQQERDDEPQPGQREQVEAEVDAVLRVGRADLAAVHPQLDRRPLLRRRAAGEEPDDDRRDDQDQAPQRLDGLAVLVEVRLLLRARCVDRPGAVAVATGSPTPRRP